MGNSTSLRTKEDRVEDWQSGRRLGQVLGLCEGNFSNTKQYVFLDGDVACSLAVSTLCGLRTEQAQYWLAWTSLSQERLPQ